MKYFYVISILLFSAILLSASSGVGEIQNKERTGTPDGDNVCSQCHSSSSFSPIVNLTITTTTNQNVTLYTPGETYLLTFMVSETTGNPSEYGFQATALLGDLSNAGTFLNPGTNVQLENVTNANVTDRHVVEHSSPSSSGVFMVEWTAPQTAEAVVFYYSSVSANGNGSSSGDSYAGGTFDFYPDSLEPQFCPGDLNETGDITAADLTIFLSIFGTSCD